MDINEALNAFWQEHGKSYNGKYDTGFKKMYNVDEYGAVIKHPIYGWYTPTRWFSKAIRHEREQYLYGE